MKAFCIEVQQNFGDYWTIKADVAKGSLTIYSIKSIGGINKQDGLCRLIIKQILNSMNSSLTASHVTVVILLFLTHSSVWYGNYLICILGNNIVPLKFDYSNFKK